MYPTGMSQQSAAYTSIAPQQVSKGTNGDAQTSAPSTVYTTNGTPVASTEPPILDDKGVSRRAYGAYVVTPICTLASMTFHTLPTQYLLLGSEGSIRLPLHFRRSPYLPRWRGRSQ